MKKYIQITSQSEEMQDFLRQKISTTDAFLNRVYSPIARKLWHEGFSELMASMWPEGYYD